MSEKDERVIRLTVWIKAFFASIFTFIVELVELVGSLFVKSAVFLFAVFLTLFVWGILTGHIDYVLVGKNLQFWSS